MEIINELVTPFNGDKEIDFDVFNKLIEKSQALDNTYQLIFSLIGDGPLLTLNEKISLVKSIKLEHIDKVIYYFQLENEEINNKTIHFLNNTEIKYIMICPQQGLNYNQNGLFLYVKNIIKKLKNKNIILHNSSLTTGVNFHFQTIKKLIRLFPNIIGLYENGKDFSLINILKNNFENFKIFLPEDLLEYALDNKIDGIVSISSLVFKDDLNTIIDDYNNNFKNTLLINYLLFVHEILSFSNNSTLFKAYLKRLGYISMEVRLPLVIEQSDIDNLDFLLS